MSVHMAPRAPAQQCQPVCYGGFASPGSRATFFSMNLKGILSHVPQVIFQRIEGNYIRNSIKINTGAEDTAQRQRALSQFLGSPGFNFQYLIYTHRLKPTLSIIIATQWFSMQTYHRLFNCFLCFRVCFSPCCVQTAGLNVASHTMSRQYE